MMHLLALGLDGLVVAAWSLRALYWIRGLARVADLTTALYDPPQLLLKLASEARPAISVIVPARDEEKAIEACLRSLLGSTGVAVEIIAVDDRSTDGTGRRMDELWDTVAASALPTAVEGTALQVLHIKEVPAGWMGKTHAMARAAAHARGKWLLFTDGDLVFAPDALARALRYAEAEQADHVVLYPTMLFETFGERMMLSFLHALSIWAIRPWRVEDPKACNDFIGIGAFNLVRRSVYDAIGGWESLRLEVLEDLRMGFTVKRSGFRQRAVFGRDLIRIRWAVGASGVVDNMTKNLFALFRFRPAPAAAAWMALLLLCLLPFAGIALGSSGVVCCAVMLVVIATLYARYYRLGLPNALYAFTFPAGGLLFLYALAKSILATSLRQGVTWRGTFYPLADLRRHAGPLR